LQEKHGGASRDEREEMKEEKEKDQRKKGS
jgi:hypothetical protein